MPVRIGAYAHHLASLASPLLAHSLAAVSPFPGAYKAVTHSRSRYHIPTYHHMASHIWIRLQSFVYSDLLG